MTVYKPFLSLDASNKLRSIRRVDQEAIISYLNYLKYSPFDEGDAVSNHDINPLFIKGVNKYLISYFVNHASKEIKITTISHVNEA